jgi:hypothetical protein
MALDNVRVSGLLCRALQSGDRLGGQHALELGRELPGHHRELHGIAS